MKVIDGTVKFLEDQRKYWEDKEKLYRAHMKWLIEARSDDSLASEMESYLNGFREANQKVNEIKNQIKLLLDFYIAIEDERKEDAEAS